MSLSCSKDIKKLLLFTSGHTLHFYCENIALLLQTMLHFDCRRVAVLSRHYLASISVLSHQYLEFVSPVSRFCLATISPVSRQYLSFILVLSHQYFSFILMVSLQFCNCTAIRVQSYGIMVLVWKSYRAIE